MKYIVIAHSYIQNAIVTILDIGKFKSPIWLVSTYFSQKLTLRLLSDKNTSQS